MMLYQKEFDRFIFQLRRETDREIASGSLEYIAYYRAYIEGRIDALKEINREQKEVKL
jgi:hypothetical protein